MMTWKAAVLLCTVITVSGQQYDDDIEYDYEEYDLQCPDREYNVYADPEQCDKYWICENGEAKPQLCPDGLFYTDSRVNHVEKCDTVFNVECGNRTYTQPPQPSKDGLCQRQNGQYPHPDSCSKFVACNEGRGIVYECPSGLQYDLVVGTCTWPNQALRENCVLKKAVLDDGFECPDEAILDPQGRKIDHPKFPHPEDCQMFYICLNGQTPRLQGCTKGLVYNIGTEQCDDPSNVEGCEGWYDYEEYDEISK